MRVAIYSSIGNRSGQDTEAQLAELRHHVLSKLPEVYEFVDRQEGKTGDRAQLKSLLEAAARREFQVVLVWALDRFVGESVSEAFANIRRLLRYDVQFVSCTEEHFRTDSPAGPCMIPIAAWIVQQERILISERTKAGLAMARAQGKRLGRPRKVFPREQVAADQQSGMSWRQLERRYNVPQSTLRSAIQTLADVGVPQPYDTADLSRTCTRKDS